MFQIHMLYYILFTKKSNKKQIFQKCISGIGDIPIRNSITAAENNPLFYQFSVKHHMLYLYIIIRILIYFRTCKPYNFFSDSIPLLEKKLEYEIYYCITHFFKVFWSTR